MPPADDTDFKPPPITQELLQFRLDTGNMGKMGGQRASLTKCAQTLGAGKFQDLNELQLFELEMTKLMLGQQQRQHQVNINAQNLQNAQDKISALQKSVLESAKEANHILSQRHATQEYEALSKLILEKHPVSQEELQKEIAEIKAQSTNLDQEINNTQATQEVCSAQFSLLIQYMNDLKRSLKEDKTDKKQSPTNQGKQPSDGDDAMDIDNDTDLYRDLSSAKRKEG